MTERLLYDAPAAAEYLSTTVTRIHELRRSRQLLAVQDGRKFKFTLAELQRYVDNLPTYEPGRTA